ncbi:MAG: hypothetical protein ABIR63_00460 [Sphingomicrobium sp.]
MARSTALPVAWVTLRILILLNWLYGAVVLAILVGFIAAPQWTLTALGIPSGSQTVPLIMGMRAVAALGLVAVPLNLAVLRRMVAMIDTVLRAGNRLSPLTPIAFRQLRGSSSGSN